MTSEEERARMIARVRHDGKEEDLTPVEARKRMIARMRLDADEGEEETRESEGGESGGQAHYGNTRLPYGLCKRFGIDLPADAKPRDAWAALEKGTGYTHDEVMEMVKKAGDTKGMKAMNGGEGEPPKAGESVDKSTKSEAANKAKSLRGMGAKEHKHFETVSEAQNYLSKELGVSVDYMDARGMTAEKANRFNDALLTAVGELGIKPDGIRGALDQGYMFVNRLKYKGQPRRKLELNICNTDFSEDESDPEKHSKSVQKVIEATKRKLKKYKNEKGFVAELYTAKYEGDLKKYQEYAKYRAWSTAVPGHELEAATFHEMGHILTSRMEDDGVSTDFIADAFARATKENENGDKDIYRISKYASTNWEEFFSECFAGYLNGMELPDYCNKMVEDVIEEFRKGKEE